jgi:hypothetical protein
MACKTYEGQLEIDTEQDKMARPIPGGFACGHCGEVYATQKQALLCYEAGQGR